MTFSSRQKPQFLKIIPWWLMTSTSSKNIGGTDAWAFPSPQIVLGDRPPVPPPRSPPMIVIQIDGHSCSQWGTLEAGADNDQAISLTRWRISIAWSLAFKSPPSWYPHWIKLEIEIRPTPKIRSIHLHRICPTHRGTRSYSSPHTNLCVATLHLHTLHGYVLLLVGIRHKIRHVTWTVVIGGIQADIRVKHDA